MTRRVRVTEDAEQDIEAAADWWAENRSVEQAIRWYAGVRRAIQALGTTAEQCAKASESWKLKCELRQMLFGLGARPSHRVVFVIDGEDVVVLRVRHVAQRSLTVDDLPI